MPQKSYSLETGGPKRLKIAWGFGWKNISIALDGTPVGSIPDRNALRAGAQFSLPDGSRLSVRLVTVWSGNVLQVLRNGSPLPGTSADPLVKIRNAAVAIFIISGMNLIFGAVAVLLNLEFLILLGIGWISLISGAVYLGLGFLVLKKLLPALIAALAIFIADTIIGLGFVLAAGRMPNIGGLLIRVLLILPMVVGVSGIREAKRRPAPGPQG